MGAQSVATRSRDLSLIREVARTGASEASARLRRWAFEHGAELSDVAAIESHVATLD
jgi:hypothetical protein